MTAMDDAMIRLLEDAAADARWPSTPDLRAAVLAQIAPPGAGARVTPGSVALASSIGSHHARRLLRPLLLAAVLALAIAGIAAGLGFRLPGVVIERVPTTPPAGTGLDLGSPIPIEEALGIDAPRVQLPAGLPRPDVAFRMGTGDRTMVTLAWRAAAGQPALPGSDLSLSLMAVPGSIDAQLLEKLLGPGTRIEPVTVNGDRGWWIEGAPHTILVRTQAGEINELQTAIAGDTLLFVRDGTLYRLESSLGKAATLQLGASLR
jgi:hypothetical protein